MRTLRFLANVISRSISYDQKVPLTVINTSKTLINTQNQFNQNLVVRSIMNSSSPIYTSKYLIEKLTKDLSADHVEIEDLSNCGCGMKFDAVIVSPQFEKKPILQRQRLVNQTLSEEMKHIHAFTMRTFTPEEWKSRSASGTK